MTRTAAMLAVIIALGAAVSAPACDRTCMTGLVDQYLAALVRHGPAGLPLSPGVRFTVDSIPMGGGTSNLQAGEIFRIRAGKIHEIEAMGASLPYGTKSGWE